jgi:predicted transcriptional regulator
MSVKSDKPGFVRSEWDDAPLTASEYRVLGHVLRRGKCFETLPNFAKACHLERKTVQAALKQLESLGMIAKRLQPGRPSIYTATNVSDWNTRAIGKKRKK